MDRRTKGVLYYWAVAIGLLAGFIIVTVDYHDVTTSGGTWIKVGLVILMLVSFVAYLVVAMEIWQRFGLLAAIIAYVVFPICVFYWFSRIGGIDPNRSAPD